MEINELIGGVWDDEGGGDDAPEVAVPADTGSQETAEAARGSADPPDEVGSAIDWSAVPEELRPTAEQLRKQLQADYTRKTQAVAELRRQFGEADPEVVRDWLRLQRLANEDPAQAAVWFETVAAQMRGQGATVPQDDTDADLFGGWSPQTETERLLMERYQDLDARQKRFEQFHEQQLQAQVVATIQREFDGLASKIGREIPEAEREQVAAFCERNRIPTVEAGWKLMNYDAELQRAIQRGVDQGAAVLQQKSSAAPAPAGIVSRADVAPSGVKGLDAITRAVTAEIGWE